MNPGYVNEAGFSLSGAHGPPVWSPTERVWRLSRHADVMAILRTPDIQVLEIHKRIQRLAKAGGRDFRSLADLLAGMFLFRNPPYHTAARRLATRTMSDLRGQLSEDAIRDVTIECLAPALAKGQVEAVAEISVPLPLAVMCRALGLSTASSDAMHRWAADIAHAWRQDLLLRDLDVIQSGAQVVLDEILKDLARARQCGSGGLAAMLRYNAEGIGLTDREIAGTAYFLALAGFETTSAFLGTAMYMLLSRPDVRRAVTSDPALLPAALDEVLRIAPPLRQLAPRIATTGTTVGGVSFEAGALLVADVEKANHDPAAFSEPGRFDIRRGATAGLAFGTGMHACLGSTLARLEGRVLLETLLFSTQCSATGDLPIWQDHPGIRRLARLDLRITPLTGKQG